MAKLKLAAVFLLFVTLFIINGCGGAGGATNPSAAANSGGGEGSSTGSGPGSGSGSGGVIGGNSGGTPVADITAVNHVIIMMQENRSFDHYFWAMTDYRQRNNIPINSSDGKIKDGSDPDAQAWLDRNISPATGGPIRPYHTGSQCTEDLTPDWAETHKEMNLHNPSGAGPGSPMDGFVNTAYFLGLSIGVLEDKTGRRPMGYFTDRELNYYYFMASQFAFGDMFFSPNPSRTSANRLFIHAATSQGYAHPDTEASTQLNAKTIWSELDAAGLSWKIYISDWGTSNPNDIKSCPIGSTSNKCFTFFKFFTDFNTRQQHVFSIDQYFIDAQNGTLPNVAFIETGMNTGRDEHPTNNNGNTPVPISKAIRVQSGAAWTAKIINALMFNPDGTVSPSWKDSVFFWTFDEGGGAMDHVPPISVPSPDGIKPKDLFAKDPPGDFTITGFRVPNFIVSPFAKKNYVSHTPMDFTAYLAFIEKRWNLPPLTRRDGYWLSTGADMTEFFDFANPPWVTPPTPPTQRQDAACDFTKQ